RTRNSPTSPHLAHNWVRLNTDRSVKIEDDFVTAGGLAELWDILDRLNLSLDRGFENILIQMDSRKAMQAVQD
ncbi:hypothetical protein Golob_002284, partial [Gossypium lobatum]|nr:hypothetical protein [Gossypium lobatum]